MVVGHGIDLCWERDGCRTTLCFGLGLIGSATIGIVMLVG